MRTETFQTPGPVAVDIRLGSGDIRLETAESETTQVTLEPLRDNEASIEAVQTARVELREMGGRFEVVVDIRGRRRLLGSAEVAVRVSAPHGLSAHCRTGSADTEGRGRFGTVEVESGSGDVSFQDVEHDAKVSAASGEIEIESVGGEARINSASGDVEIGKIGGDARINSASGDIDLGEVGGRLEVHSASGDVEAKEAHGDISTATASGDQSVGSVAQGSVSLKSASGDLRVGIKSGSKLFVDARSRSGTVSSELNVSDAPSEGDAPLVELRANTMSGDIQIFRA